LDEVTVISALVFVRLHNVSVSWQSNDLNSNLIPDFLLSSMPSAAAEIRVDDVDNAAPVTFDRLIIILVSSLLYKVNMLLQAYYQFSLVEIKLGLGIFYYQHLPQLTHGRSQSNMSLG
jgi:hypothetical protein